MQSDADASLEVRVPITAGPHLVGVSFVRQMWEPEGLPQPLQRGRVTDERSDLHGLRSCRGGVDRGPVCRSHLADRYAESPRDFRLRTAPRIGRARLRREGALETRQAGVSPARHALGRADAARLLRERPARGWKLRRRDSVRARASARRPRFSVARVPGSCPPPLDVRARSHGEASGAENGIAISPERSRARLAPVVLPLEQHSRRAPASIGRTPAARHPGSAGAAGAAHDGGCASHARPGRQLCRAVVESPPRPRSRRASRLLSGFRREPARSLRTGNEAVCWEHAARGPQRGRICCAPTTRS